METSPAQLSSLVEAISAQAMKWNKPLTARMLPSAVNADGMTRLAHDFLVNTTPVQLRSRDFATQTDTASFFEPVGVAQDRATGEFEHATANLLSIAREPSTDLLSCRG